MLGSVSVGAWSYLNAVGRPGVVAWATASFGIVWIPTTAVLLPVFGLAAIGVGNLIGALVEVWLLDRATRQSANVTPYRPLVEPLLVSVVAGGPGGSCASSASRDRDGSGSSDADLSALSRRLVLLLLR